MNAEEQGNAIAEIKELAATAVEKLGPLSNIDDFDFNRPSIQWIEGFIERERERRGDGEIPEGLVNILGAHLGESIIASAGGFWDWCDPPGDWCLLFPSNSRSFPFTKVWKQFKNGLEGGDSIVSFYDITVNFVAKGLLNS